MDVPFVPAMIWHEGELPVAVVHASGSVLPETLVVEANVVNQMLPLLSAQKYCRFGGVSVGLLCDDADTMVPAASVIE